jgi:hypothetical protein
MRLDAALAGAGATSDVETEGGQGRASPFVITSQVLQQPDWTPQVVSARQKSAVDTLRKLWACLRAMDRYAITCGSFRAT